VLTGETGAGKSIMMRAIGLLSGGRGSVDWIRSGADSCTVEALFSIDEHYQAMRRRLAEGGFDDDTEILVKRIIGRNGRSRFYINGSLATAKMVADICYHLLSVAGQHDHQQLLQPALHLDFLDILGDNSGALQSFKTRYADWRSALQQLVDLRSREQQREQRRDFLVFQIGEIDEVSPEIGEDAALSLERGRLKHGEALIRLSHQCYELLASTITEQLGVIRKNLEQMREMDPALEKLSEELSSYSFLAEDYSARMRSYHDRLEDDPARLEQVNARLDMLQGIKRKYGETLEMVLDFRKKAQQELDMLENLDREIEEQRLKTERLEQDAMLAAKNLSQLRRKAAAELERAMAAELDSLNFARAAIEVRFAALEQTAESLRATGFDRVEFFFTANPGEPPRPLAKVASGGELSRLMLAFKCLLARRDMVETVIFDEVDTGIGGEAAESVARKIQELADHHQVICITHLPQIAARGTEHFRVEKRLYRGRTLTSVSPLSEEERVAELARMLAGDSVTRQTEAWARELLDKGKKAA
jgi:DNA repair protein RecN (Recombination protein N)